MTSNEEISVLDDGSTSPISFRYLRKFNLTMAILHFVQGIAMIILGFVQPTLKAFEIPVWTMYNDFVEVAPGTVIPQTVSEQLGIFKYVGPTVGSFLLLSAIAHALIAGPLFGYYVKNLKKKMNPIRWFEYALSSSIMVSFIALLFGVREVWVLVLIFGANALMNLFGHVMEVHNQTTEKTNWLAYIYGWIAGMLPWLVISFYFGRAASDAEGMPWFVPVIYVIQFLLFMSFAFNMLLQYKQVGKWKDYLYGERVYQILSLVAKTLLAWLVFAGALQPG
ncbi:MAG: heliorhodopsin HeR [Asgard group archaeon]|nr:heliorhodopsin HeR [Asgard group archaeon]